MDAGNRFLRLGATTLPALLAILAGTACQTADAPALTVLSVPDRQNAAPSVAARGTEVIVAWGATPAEGPPQIFIAKQRRQRPHLRRAGACERRRGDGARVGGTGTTGRDRRPGYRRDVDRQT